MTVQDLFDNVRIDLDDVAENHYTDSMLVQWYNRLRNSIQAHLMRLNAMIGAKESSVASVVGTQEYELPTDFAAMVERSFRESTSHLAFDQIDEQEKALSTQGNGDSTAFYITVSGTTQYVGLKHPAASVKTFNFKYWPKITRLAEANIGSTEMPYLGLLDDLFHEALVFRGRNQREFSAQVEQVWLAAAKNDVETILGLRKNKERFRVPSMFKGMPRWR